MNYRTDIDGLRTIAVFIVILNHAGFTLFSGGFVGVDVFFVISGFLITSIIYPKILDKKFSIGWFLSRRIKRLMPVLFFIVFITMLAFTFILLPMDLAKFYQSVIWVLMYAGNFFMWIHHGGYFDGNSQEVPLLHTWSLAVEEQYYFVWPIMLILSVHFLGKKATAWLSLGLFILLTVFSQWGTEVTVGAAYYLLPTRFFELLLGSCLAIFWDKLPKINVITQHIFSLLGLGLIMLSAVFLNELSPFPGYNALYSTVGTALIIYARGGVVNRFLSFKPMVYSGNISYSLYLWHWPIFTFLRYISIEMTLVVQFFAILITYVLSMFSYRYIEEPFRHSRINAFLPIATKFYLLPSMLFISMAWFGIHQNGFQWRFDKQIVEMEQALNTHASDSRQACHSAFRDAQKLPSESCIIGIKNERTKDKGVFVFGDSHANHLVPFFEELILRTNLWGQDYTLDRCLPIFDLNWGGNLFKSQRCKQRNDLALQHIQENNFGYVVMAASWPGIDTRRMFNDVERILDREEKRKLFNEKLLKTVGLILEQGAVPILVEDTPVLAGKSPKCPISKIVFDTNINCDIQKNENNFISEAFANAKAIYPQIIVIKPSELFCNNSVCQMQMKGIPLYRDDDHLNEVGAKILAKEYLMKFGTIFSDDTNT